jgi:hypothetical protein
MTPLDGTLDLLMGNAYFEDDIAPFHETSHLLGHHWTLSDETLQPLEETFYFWSPYTSPLSDSSTL